MGRMSRATADRYTARHRAIGLCTKCSNPTYLGGDPLPEAQGIEAPEDASAHRLEAVASREARAAAAGGHAANVTIKTPLTHNDADSFVDEATGSRGRFKGICMHERCISMVMAVDVASREQSGAKELLAAALPARVYLEAVLKHDPPVGMANLQLLRGIVAGLKKAGA